MAPSRRTDCPGRPYAPSREKPVSPARSSRRNRRARRPSPGRYCRRRWNRRRCSQEKHAWPASLPCSGIGFEPAEAVDGLAARIVFAADKAVIAEPVEFGEQKWIVQLLAVGLIARGNAGDLDVADNR